METAIQNAKLNKTSPEKDTELSQVIACLSTMLVWSDQIRIDRSIESKI